jgi:hypothetical protein
LSHRFVLKFDGLTRSTFRTIGDLSGGLNIPADCIPRLRLGNQFSPGSPFWIPKMSFMTSLDWISSYTYLLLAGFWQVLISSRLGASG